MSFTVATVRPGKNAMHCSNGHKFHSKQVWNDGYGDWCPECTRAAHSGSKDDCQFCNMDPRNLLPPKK